MNPQTVTDVASQLVSGAGRNIENLCAAPCPQGGNNRMWRIECASGRYAAKSYFRHPADERDRLATESIFVAYARKAGIDTVPSAMPSRRFRTGFTWGTPLCCRLPTTASTS